MKSKPIDLPETLPDWLLPWPTFSIDWARAALIVIDCQNYSCNPHMALMKEIRDKFPKVADYYVPRITESVIPNTARLINGFRNAHREVVYTRHGSFLSDGRDLIRRRRQRETDHLESVGIPHLWPPAASEHDVVEPLKPLPRELVLDKNSSSPFNSTGIDQLLRNLNIETLVVTGMATEMCVESTSRDAADRGYQVIVVEDAVATFFEEHHIASLSALSRVFAQIWDTDRVLSALAAV